MFTAAKGLTACHPRSARRLSGLNPLFCFEHRSEERTRQTAAGERGALSFILMSLGDWLHALCVRTLK